jgi:WD40 repeat protein
LFGVLLANRNICFVEDGELQKNLGVLRPTGNEMDIKYLSMHKLWAVTCHNAILQLFSSPKATSIPNKIIFQPHAEPLTGVEEIGCPQSVVTASLDGTIKLWHPTAGKLIIELSAEHELSLPPEEQKGVKGIAVFSQGITSYICSWMFTTQLFLWLPSLSLSKPFAGELKGHLGLVLDCVFSWRG